MKWTTLPVPPELRAQYERWDALGERKWGETKTEYDETVASYAIAKVRGEWVSPDIRQSLMRYTLLALLKDKLERRLLGDDELKWMRALEKEDGGKTREARLLPNIIAKKGNDRIRRVLARAEKRAQRAASDLR